jgi:peptidoglycan hydrolase-like protein with peptidoglycan-binding domain
VSAENNKKVKEALRERFHYPGPLDGVIDQGTRHALREFQRLSHLFVTGVVDEQTAARLGGVWPESTAD